MTNVSLNYFNGTDYEELNVVSSDSSKQYEVVEYIGTAQMSGDQYVNSVNFTINPNLVIIATKITCYNIQQNSLIDLVFYFYTGENWKWSNTFYKLSTEYSQIYYKLYNNQLERKGYRYKSGGGPIASNIPNIFQMGNGVTYICFAFDIN